MADPKTPKAPTEAELAAGPQPGGGAETMAEVVATAKEAAKVRQTSAEAAADAAAELAKIAGLPMQPLNRPTEDALGRDLPSDPAEARVQQREAAAIRQQRVEVDVARVQRGLPPIYADK